MHTLFWRLIFLYLMYARRAYLLRPDWRDVTWRLLWGSKSLNMHLSLVLPCVLVAAR